MFGFNSYECNTRSLKICIENNKWTILQKKQETKLFTFALHEICMENSFAPGWGDNLNNRCGENQDLWFFPKNIFCLYTACT
jgi:hypothetical protein